MTTQDSKQAPNNIITELSYETHINQKFKLTRFSRSFVIEKLESDADLETLKEFFQKCIDITLQKAKEVNMNPDKINVKFTSDLLSSDILLSFQTLSQNNAAVILDLFITIPQRTYNKEPMDITKTVFKITLTGVDVKAITNMTGRK